LITIRRRSTRYTAKRYCSFTINTGATPTKRLGLDKASRRFRIEYNNLPEEGING